MHNLDVSILLNLFDTHVSSVLSYGCEVWGFRSAPSIELVHEKFIKRILNVCTNVNDVTVYGETGRFPLELNRKICMLK